MTDKLFNTVTALATSVIALALATPLLIPLALFVLALGCGLCCVLTGAIGTISPPA